MSDKKDLSEERLDNIVKQQIRQLDYNPIQLSDDEKEKIRLLAISRGKKEQKTNLANLGFMAFLKRYPWQTALGMAVLQTLTCILALGDTYTSMFFHLIGGR